MKLVNRTTHLITLENRQDSVDFLLLSDVHFDSKKCERALLKRHLDKALEEKRYIHINGDLFDAMGAKRDPRSVPSDIRPEYLKDGNYFDLIVQDAAAFLEPYKERLFITRGNHETSINRHHHIDLIDQVALKLWGNDASDHVGGYSGFLVVKFQYAENNTTSKFQIHYHHSIRGGSRSLGVLDVQLNAMRYPTADLLLRGHIHQKWVIPTNYGNFLNSTSLKVTKKKQYHVCTGSYKDGIADGFAGYEVEKMYNNSMLGGYFCTITRDSNKNFRLVFSEE